MPTCNNLTAADYVLMLIQIAGIGLLLLFALDLFRRACKHALLVLWLIVTKPFRKEAAK